MPYLARPRRQPPLPLPGAAGRARLDARLRRARPRPGQRRARRRATGSSRWPATARQHGLGLVVDVVPNHMALVAPESSNAPLWDVLAHGRDAAHAHWFDVDWDALDGRIGLPVLWEPLADVLAKGDLRLGEENGGQVLRYHDHVFPVADGTWDGDPSADVAAVLDAPALPAWPAGASATRCSTTAGSSTSTALIAVRVEEPGRLRGHPPGAGRPQPPRHRRGLPHRPPRRAGRPRRVPRAAARRAPARHRDLGREDPRGRRDCCPPGPATAPPGTTPPRSSPRALRRPGRRARAASTPGRTPAATRRWSTSSPRPSARSSPTCWSPSAAGWSGGPARRCPTPTRRGSPRRSTSCWSPARSTAPTCAPARPTDELARQRLERRLRDRRRRPAPDLDDRARQLVGPAPPTPIDEAAPRLRGPAAADLGPGDGQGHRGHRVLPLAPAGRASTRSAATPTCSRSPPPSSCTPGRSTSSSTGRSA